MVFAASLLLFAAGLLLYLWGQHGRVIDNHPLCADCGYGLNGIEGTSNECPECGNDVTDPVARTIGHRKPRRWAQALGVVVMVLTAILGPLTVAGVLDQVEWFGHEPLFVLRWQLTTRAQSTRTRVLAELHRRVDSGKLSITDIAPIVDDILTWQGDPKRPWITQAGDLVELAHTRGLLTAPVWNRYVDQYTALELRLHPEHAHYIVCQQRDAETALVVELTIPDVLGPERYVFGLRRVAPSPGRLLV